MGSQWSRFTVRDPRRTSVYCRLHSGRNSALAPCRLFQPPQSSYRRAHSVVCDDVTYWLRAKILAAGCHPVSSRYWVRWTVFCHIFVDKECSYFQSYVASCFITTLVLLQFLVAPLACCCEEAQLKQSLSVTKNVSEAQPHRLQFTHRVKVQTKMDQKVRCKGGLKLIFVDQI